MSLTQTTEAVRYDAARPYLTLCRLKGLIKSSVVFKITACRELIQFKNPTDQILSGKIVYCHIRFIFSKNLFSDVLILQEVAATAEKAFVYHHYCQLCSKL